MPRINLYEQWAATSPLGDRPTYTDKYSDKLDELYGKYANRGPFQYDAAKDPLFQSYKDNYVRQGKMAMKDTMGQAAALTGGYANSYGQQVGQQAYDAYLQNLNEVIPTLYGMAFDQYQAAGDQLLKQYGMLGDMRDRDYGLYRDALADWTSNRDFLANLQADDYNRDFNERQFAYQQEQDAYARALEQQRFAYEKEQDAYKRQWDEENRAYQREQDAYQKAWNEENRDYERAWNEEGRAYQKEQDAYTRAWNEENRDYERAWNEEGRSYDRIWNEENRSYNRQQDAYANLYAMIKGSGYRPSDGELAAAGMSRAAADAIAAEYQRGVDMDERNMSLRESSAYSGGGSGGGGGRSPGTVYGDGWYTTPDGTTYVGPAYMGDIWSDSQQQYRDYGYQTTTNDLNRAWNSGKITPNQYVTGQTAADILWTIDHATNVANAAAAKQNTSKTKTAGEDWREIRKKLGI